MNSYLTPLPADRRWLMSSSGRRGVFGKWNGSHTKKDLSDIRYWIYLVSYLVSHLTLPRILQVLQRQSTISITKTSIRVFFGANSCNSDRKNFRWDVELRVRKLESLVCMHTVSSMCEK
jgi:hypothetical protein